LVYQKGKWNPVISTFSYNYPNTEWWQEGLTYPAAWASNFPNSQNDIYLGTATDFSNTFETIAYMPPLFGDAIAAASILTIHNLINITQSLDSAVLVAYAKSGVNITNSFYGEISFNGISIARPYICLQNLDQTYPIIGPNYYALSSVNFNPSIKYPANFFSNGNNDLRNVLIATLGFLFVACIVAILVVIIILKKFHLVFLKKRNAFA